MNLCNYMASKALSSGKNDCKSYLPSEVNIRREMALKQFYLYYLASRIKAIIKRINPIDKFLWFCFTCWILIDSINGLTRVVGVEIPFSQIVKFGVFIVVLVRMIHIDSIKILTSIILIYIILVSLNVYSLGNNVKDAMVLVFKPITTFYFYYYFWYFSVKNRLFFERVFEKVIVVNFIFLASNIVLGLMGYGNYVYSIGKEEGLGIKGFIISQNEISLVVASIYPVLLCICSSRFKRLTYYTICVLIMLVSYSISTKASIISAIFSIVFVSFFTGQKRERKLILFISATLFVLFITYISVVLESEIGFIQRFSFFLEDRGLLGALFSGRLDQLELESRIFFERTDFITQLIGQGEISCELDPFQALFSFGYIGGLANVILLLILLFRTWLKRKKSVYEKGVAFSNTIIVLLSVTSGHVFFSSMGGLFLALNNAWVSGKLNQRLLRWGRL